MKDNFLKKNIPLSPADLVHQEASWKYKDEIEKTNKQTSRLPSNKMKQNFKNIICSFTLTLLPWW